MRDWLREYAETLRRYDGTSGSSSHQTQRSDSRSVRFLVWQGRERAVEGKGQRQRQGDKSKDQKPISKPEQFQEHCGYCDKWGHKRADCRKGIARASADNDGDVAAVMEGDDVVMRIGHDETSTGWCLLLQVCVLPWDQQVLSSWTAEVTNTCAHRSLRT